MPTLIVKRRLALIDTGIFGNDLLQTRHRSLLHKRAPAARLRSYTGPRESRKTGRNATSLKPRPASILVVEDHPAVGDAVKGVLESEGRRVEVRADGPSGRREIEGDAHFDLLILDYELPGVNGVELIRLARGSRTGGARRSSCSRPATSKAKR